MDLDKRDSIISVVTTPLGFFALSLLIVEGFLGIIIIGSGNTLTSDAKVSGMWMAIFAFGGISTIVALMVWKIPKHLMLRGQDWAEQMKNEKSWADSSDPLSKNVLEALLKSRSTTSVSKSTRRRVNKRR